MNKISAHSEYSSVCFLYAASLFILVNFYGKFYRTIVGWIAFALTSFLLIRISNTKAFRNDKRKNALEVILSISAVVTSVGFELGIVTGIYSTLSEAKSGISDNCFFAVFIVIASVILSLKGRGTIHRAAVLLWGVALIPFIPCVISLFMNGADYGFITTIRGTSIITEISGGIISSLLFFGDIKICEKQCKTNDNSTHYFTKGAFCAAGFILLFGLSLSLTLGSTLYSVSDSPIFALTRAVSSFGITELLLTVYAICLLFRCIIKILYIREAMKAFGISERVRSISAFFICTVISLCGVVFVQYYRAFVFGCVITALMNATAFILVPTVGKIFRKTD